MSPIEFTQLLLREIFDSSYEYLMNDSSLTKKFENSFPCWISLENSKRFSTRRLTNWISLRRRVAHSRFIDCNFIHKFPTKLSATRAKSIEVGMEVVGRTISRNKTFFCLASAFSVLIYQFGIPLTTKFVWLQCELKRENVKFNRIKSIKILFHSHVYWNDFIRWSHPEREVRLMDYNKAIRSL